MMNKHLSDENISHKVVTQLGPALELQSKRLDFLTGEII